MWVNFGVQVGLEYIVDFMILTQSSWLDLYLLYMPTPQNI